MSSAPASPAQVERLADEAKVYAALSGTFDPREALPAPEEGREDLMVDIAADLAARCDTNPDDGNGWLLRTSERRYVIETLKKRGKLRKAIADRRSLGADQESSDLLAALEGRSPFSVKEIQAAIASPPSEEHIRRIVVALDRAGMRPELLQYARASLAALGREQRRKMLRERGFFGRKHEQAMLSNWLAKGQTKTPVKAAYLAGLPGIGKSALIEEMVGVTLDRDQALTVRLDFDRAGLDVLDILGLTMEVARQLGERLGDQGQPLLKARLVAASQLSGEERIGTSRRARIPTDLGGEIGASVRRSGRPVTLVLDTLEVLRARGVKHPRLLFDWIDRLVGLGLKPLRIIAAGRGDALEDCPERAGIRIDLKGLDDAAAKELLERLKVAPGNRQPILEIAKGNPLVLRLAAEVVNRFGAGELPKDLGKEVTAGHLYRFLLSRIDDPLLRKLAHPGLITRRISAALLREVLAEIVGIENLSEKDSLVAFESLAAQHWLVMPDPTDTEFVIHRSDMRRSLLPLLYAEEPELCARIDAAAVTWFGRRDDHLSQVDATYHRLQLLRQRKGRPLISTTIASQFDDDMLAELPDRARQLVIRARHGRSEMFQPGMAPKTGPADDEQLAIELTNLISRQDWAEGQYVVDQAVDAGGFDARSQAADAVRAFYWRAGRWSEALRLLGERDRLGADDQDLKQLAWPLALARLEMRAEFTPGRLARILDPALAERLSDDFNKTPLSVARSGAVAFQLAARDPDYPRAATYREEVDPVGAAFEMWSGAPGPRVRRAVEVAHGTLASRGAEIKRGSEAETAQLLAAHSPYVLFAANLGTQSAYGWLEQVAGQCASRLWDLGGLFVPRRPWPEPPPTQAPLLEISALGLFAEWLSAVAFIERDPNLRLIGRAAERWRRTIAGHWSYGRRPRSWTSARSLDVVIAERTMAAAVEPMDAEQVFEVWTDRRGLHRTAEGIKTRLARPLWAVTKPMSSLGRAELLLSKWVPSAFVPGLVEKLRREFGEGADNG